MVHKPLGADRRYDVPLSAVCGDSQDPLWLFCGSQMAPELHFTSFSVTLCKTNIKEEEYMTRVCLVLVYDNCRATEERERRGL